MTSETSPVPQQSPLIQALYYLSFVPLVLVVLTFGVHSVQGLTGAQELKDIIGVIGLGGTITTVLVFFTGLHDGAVTAMLLVKGKLFPKLPWWPVFLYAGIWPFVPRVMIWMGGGPFEWIEVLIFGAMSAAAYAAHLYRPRLAPKG